MTNNNKLIVCLGVFALLFAFGVGTANAHFIDANRDGQNDPHTHTPPPTASEAGSFTHVTSYPLIRNLGEDSFIVHQKQLPSAIPSNGIARAVATHTTSNVTGTPNPPENYLFPDLDDFLRFGGTIELLLVVGPKIRGTFQNEAGFPNTTQTIVSDGDNTTSFTNYHPDGHLSSQRKISAKLAASFAYRLVMTEIMWALDRSYTGSSQQVFQWIEIYNNGPATKQLDEIFFNFVANKKLDRVGQAVPIPYRAVNRTYTDTVLEGSEIFVVVDSINIVNRFGIPWALKGGSGNSQPLLSNDGGETPVTNLVSMYRKINLNGDKYKKKTDMTIAGLTVKNGLDGLGHGHEAGSWETSVGRVNMSGNLIGSPGAVHHQYGGSGTFTRNPGSLPVGSVIINEIFNSDTLQWVELHNTGSSEVNVKNYELDAIHGDKKVQRVFAVPNKDTKIPPGGFLLITSRDPSQSILAGGTDLYNSNKFPDGAEHLYIVIPKDNTNKWMPEKNFLLLLRNGNDKNNHEKVVDMAGNYFIKLINDSMRTDVWPLIGWTVPGDRDNNDWGGANNSLMRNPGKTYARIDQKSGGNRLHKDHWRMDGPVGGLGYDPRVDLEMAPGTPGYANNGQKNNLAGLTSNVASKVVISEIMYDPGDDGKLTQWIELYNSSMVHSVSLKDWKLEIRNIDTDVQSYVDSNFKFDSEAIILPNQTLLLVSDRSGVGDVLPNRLYNLYQKHRTDLGLSNRRSVLLSSLGFYLRLTDKDNKEVDVVGNVTLDGPRRDAEWKLADIKPMGDEMRRSIVRQFGSRKRDGSADAANDGTMLSAWRRAESVGSFYGHRDDIGSPGHREGSPLPVSLSSFRPVRDAETGAVVIRWTTESELNNAGFNILRSDAKEGAFTVVNVKGLIAGHGTTSEKHTYTYTDTTAKPNVVYYYQIEDVSLDGQRTTLRTTHLRGNVTAGGKLTTVWSHLKFQK